MRTYHQILLGQTLRSIDLRGVRLIEANYAPGTRFARHAHERANITLIIRGQLEECVDRHAVQATSLSVVVKPATDGAELSVADDGPGIAAEESSRVFERFYTTRRHDKGTGLGLALVRAIVEAHGGKVSVVSELGQGATFKAHFPPSA